MCVWVAALTLSFPAVQAREPVGTAFTYQGSLSKNGESVDDRADFRFRLWDQATDGNTIGPLVTVNNKSVADGLFTVMLDFGVDPYTENEARWLETEVRSPSGQGEFEKFESRQRLTPTPFSLATRGINVAANGFVGIGTATPNALLELLSPERDHGVLATCQGIPIWGHRTSTVGTWPAVQGQCDSLSSGASAIRGQITSKSPGASSTGVLGHNFSTTGSGIGVWGRQDGSGFGVYGYTPSGRGVYGESPSGTGVWGQSGSVGVHGLHTGGGTFPGVWGDSNSTSAGATGVRGIINSTSPGANSTGVLGLNKGTGGAGMGVWGRHDGVGYGVYGSSKGVGVFGESTTAAGVIGKSSTGLGVLGQSVDWYGVQGTSTKRTGVDGRSTDGEGVRGLSSSTYGVHGSSIRSYGVYGETKSTSREAAGVTGVVSSSAAGHFSAGVRGINNNLERGVSAVGVYGIQVAEGYGVYGEALGNLSDNRGVQGETHSPSGWGVFCVGNFGATGDKEFIQPHPSDPSKQIEFVSLEGNESGTYFRGSSRLVNGQAVIEVPEEFRLVSETEGLTVQLTPKGPNADLWVESESLDRVIVRGNGNVEFNYFVNGVRRGFADLELIRENHAYVPVERGVPYGTQYRADHRRILVENGILNPDFTPNEETAARMGWTLRDPKPEELLGPAGVSER